MPSLKSRINRRLNNSSNWILNSPDSFTLLMLMGTGLAGIAFSIFAITTIFSKFYFFSIVFAFFAYSSIKQFIKLFKLYKTFGLKKAMGGFTANQFVWKRNKDGGKINGNVGYKSDESGCGNDEETNRRFGEEIKHIYRQSK